MRGGQIWGDSDIRRLKSSRIFEMPRIGMGFRGRAASDRNSIRCVFRGMMYSSQLPSIIVVFFCISLHTHDITCMKHTVCGESDVKLFIKCIDMFVC